MTYPYGQAFTARFYPLVDDAAYTPALTTGSLVAAYLFDRRPTLSEARTGSGALVSPVLPNSWDWDATAGAFELAVPAVTDPDPTSIAYATRTYFLAVNWRLETGGPVQTTVQPLALERPRSQGAALLIATADLKRVYSYVDTYFDEVTTAEAIAQAREDVRDDLQAKGYRWAGVSRPDRLKQLVVRRALYLLMVSEAQNPADKFWAKCQEFKGLYATALDGLRVEYDLSGDGLPDPEPTGGADAVQTLFVIR